MYPRVYRQAGHTAPSRARGAGPATELRSQARTVQDKPKGMKRACPHVGVTLRFVVKLLVSRGFSDRPVCPAHPGYDVNEPNRPAVPSGTPDVGRPGDVRLQAYRHATPVCQGFPPVRAPPARAGSLL